MATLAILFCYKIAICLKDSSVKSHNSSTTICKIRMNVVYFHWMGVGVESFKGVLLYKSTSYHADR